MGDGKYWIAGAGILIACISHPGLFTIVLITSIIVVIIAVICVCFSNSNSSSEMNGSNRNNGPHSDYTSNNRDVSYFTTKSTESLSDKETIRSTNISNITNNKFSKPNKDDVSFTKRNNPPIFNDKYTSSLVYPPSEQRLLEHSSKAKECMESFYTEFFSIMLKHFSVLYKKYKQNSYIDDYGHIKDAGWIKEVDYFAENVLKKELESSNKIKYPNEPFIILYLYSINVSIDSKEIDLTKTKDIKCVAKINFNKNEFGREDERIKNIAKYLNIKHIEFLQKWVRNIEQGKSNPRPEEITDTDKPALIEFLNKTMLNETPSKNPLLFITKNFLLGEDNIMVSSDKIKLPYLVKHFFGIIKEHIVEFPVNFDQEMTPYEFEHKCAEALQELGFTARATQGSGDQGVDVIAEKNGKTVAIQCKLYSSPVGNKAVQEVIAGMRFYHADIGAVVSNAPYTPSAKQLAGTCDIFLLGVTDLYLLDELVK